MSENDYKNVEIHIGFRCDIKQVPGGGPSATALRQPVPSVGGHIADGDHLLTRDAPGLLPAEQLVPHLTKSSGSEKLEGDGLFNSYGIFGAPGSGKTYLVKYLLRQILAVHRDRPDLKIGALILDPKAALIDDIRHLVRKEDVGRESDLVILNREELVRTGASCNVIDCRVDPHALAELLVLAARSAGIAARDEFWFLEWANLFGAALYLMDTHSLPELGYSCGDVVTLKRLLDSLLLMDEVGRDEEGKPLYLRPIQRLARAARTELSDLPEGQRGDTQSAVNEIERFFRSDYANTVLAFVSRAYGPFQRSQYACFSPRRTTKGRTTPFYEQILREGKIVLVSLSPSDPLTAKMLCTLIKSLFQQTVLQREDRTRPVLLACDEYGEIASEVPGQPMGDGRFFSLAREFRCMGLLATQSVNVLQATSLKENWRSVFSTFAAKLFMRLADYETARAASDQAGPSDWYVGSRSLSQGKEGVSAGDQTSLQQRAALPIELMTRLFRRGDAVMLGSLDGQETPACMRFLHVPDEIEQEHYKTYLTMSDSEATTWGQRSQTAAILDHTPLTPESVARPLVSSGATVSAASVPPRSPSGPGYRAMEEVLNSWENR